MSSRNLYSDFLPTEVDILPDQLLFRCSALNQSRNCSQNLLEDESFSTALSEPPNINWSSFNVWDYDNTAHAGQGAGATTPLMTFSDPWSSPDVASSDPNNTWVTNASTHSIPVTSMSPRIDMPLSIWACSSLDNNSDLPIRQPQSQYISLSTQICPPSLDANTAAVQVSYPPYDPPNNLHQGNGNTTSRPTVDKNSQFRPRAGSGSTSTSNPKPKIHHCPRCEKTFARPLDLQRHIDGVHLRIRHHCHEAGCGNNHGRGYCRLEKLRKHVLDVHGHF